MEKPIHRGNRMTTFEKAYWYGLTLLERGIITYIEFVSMTDDELIERFNREKPHD